MSKTPITDREYREQKKYYRSRREEGWPDFDETVDWDFARELEIELDETHREWKSDSRLLGGALLLLEEHGIKVGSEMLIAAAERNEKK